MGPSFGFASGALTMLLSAVLTAGLGPWLPYQMLAAGWVGMGAGYVGRISGRGSSPKTIAALSLYGCAAGFAYVTLDLRGLRSGSLNETLTHIELPTL